MKRVQLLLTTVICLVTTAAFAQNVAINEDGTAANANAILDVRSLTKGVLLPRVSTAGRLAIPNTKGMLVYDTTTNSYWFNTGTSWQNLSQSAATAAGWSLKGNSGTDSSTFLGTTDLKPIVIKANNVLSGRIDPRSNGNTFWGYSTAPSIKQDSAANNTGVGSSALSALTTGILNTAVGASALWSNSTGGGNTAIGYGSLTVNSTGIANTAGGLNALGLNSNGNSNTAFGSYAAFNMGHGSFNTAVGMQALYNNIVGTFNTAIGYEAGYFFNVGDFNTAIGANSTTSGGSNSTAIGYDAFAIAPNSVRIGNSAVTVIEGQVPFTTPSDGRFKFQVQEDVKGLDFIMQLRPVTYQFDVRRFDAHHRQGGSMSKPADPEGNVMKAAYDEATAIRRSGFIAQEVEKAANASGYNFSGIVKPKTEQEHYSLSYEAFVVPLVKGMQEQQRIIEAQNKKIEAQAKALATLQQQMDEIKKRLSL